jgi:hypothetical protein
MKIDLSDDFVERLKAYNAEYEGRASIASIIEDVVDTHMELWPWSCGDICAHADECMHRKTVEQWKEEQK